LSPRFTGLGDRTNEWFAHLEDALLGVGNVHRLFF
jgi:hypothetical protein